MAMTRRRAILLGSTVFGLPSVARTQTWPTGRHPRSRLCGRGRPDINARGLAQAMPAVTGQPAIVDNRGGAGGPIGIRAAAGARPDGQTLLYATAPTSSSSRGCKRAYRHPHRPTPICQTTVYQYALMVSGTGIDMVMNGWHGLFAPAKTPDAILDKIVKDAKRALTLEVARSVGPGRKRSRRPTARAPSSPGSSPMSTPSGAGSSRNSGSRWNDLDCVVLKWPPSQNLTLGSVLAARESLSVAEGNN